MGDNLVGNVLHQSFAILHTYHLMSVVNTNEDSASLRIGKAANPLQVLVVPRLLVFDVLTFILIYLHLSLSNFVCT